MSIPLKEGWMKVLIGGLLFWSFIPHSANAEDVTLPPTKADQALQDLKNSVLEKQRAANAIHQENALLSAEVETLQNDLIKAAQSIQDREATLSSLEQQLQTLAKEEKDKEESLITKKNQLSRILTILHRISKNPDEVLLTQPSALTDTVRTSILLRDLVPKINEQARLLNEEITALSLIRSDIATKRLTIIDNSRELDKEHRRLLKLLEQKSLLQKNSQAQASLLDKRVKVLASAAMDLQDLLSQLEVERKKQAEEIRQKELAMARERQGNLRTTIAGNSFAPKTRLNDQTVISVNPTRPFSRAQGLIPFPVTGRITTAFGQIDSNQAPSRGIVMETRPSAQIISPYDGQIMFAGDFKGYGKLLIIEHGEGYHTLLSGMSHIDGTVGQKLLAGEPVGVMSSPGGQTLLYIELRHNGQPVNPLLWFTARNLKVAG
jgi:septal ring factor EnvC (AmiA/AmiB activator)